MLRPIPREDSGSFLRIVSEPDKAGFDLRGLENTKSLRGAGAVERCVRRKCVNARPDPVLARPDPVLAQDLTPFLRSRPDPVLALVCDPVLVDPVLARPDPVLGVTPFLDPVLDQRGFAGTTLAAFDGKH